MKTFKKVNKTVLLLGLILIINVLTSCSKKKEANVFSSDNDTIPVKTILLAKKEVSLPIHASGKFTTANETFLSFKTGGIVSNVYVNEGEFVTKGTLLACLDLTEIRALVTQAELGFEKSQRDFIRVQNLYKDSVATLEQYENCKTALDVASATLKSAKFNLEYSKITAINNGYILKKFVNSGQIISPGAPAFQCSGEGEGDWKFQASVSDKEWSSISLNDNASIVTDAFPNQEIHGTVINKSQGTDPYTGTFMIEIKITDQTSILATGLYGKATITKKNSSPFWSIPYEALLEGNGGKGFVFVTNDNNTAQKIEVPIAMIGKNEIYVKDGLENAKHLIISGSAYLSNGSFIKVLNN